MSKRTVTELQSTSQQDGQAFTKVSSTSTKRESVSNGEMGEFEDAWEDEIESDEDVVDGQGIQTEDGAYPI